MPNLAISLHATTDEQRSELVPPNRKYPLAEILDDVPAVPAEKRSRITFEYVMLDGVNDTPEDARASRAAARRDQGEGEPDSAQPGAGHSVRAARQMSASIGLRRSSPTVISRCQCARAAARTFAPRAVS